MTEARTGGLNSWRLGIAAAASLAVYVLGLCVERKMLLGIKARAEAVAGRRTEAIQARSIR